MGKASFLQSSFLGGLWTKSYQGRADIPTYDFAMAECLNALPLESGAWTRRPGTIHGGTTRGGAWARLIEFPFYSEQSYTMEFTAGHLRLWAQNFPVLQSSIEVLSTSQTTPMVVQTVAPYYLGNGNSVLFQFGAPYEISLANEQYAPNVPLGASELYHRNLVITIIDSTHFSVADEVTGLPIDGSLFTLPPNTYVAQFVDLPTAYDTQEAIEAIVAISDGSESIMVNGTQPTSLHVLAYPTASYPYFNFAFGNWTPGNGPYLDPDISDSFVLGILGLNTNFTVSSITNINNGEGFQATDVGRWIMFFPEPPSFEIGTVYSYGEGVAWPLQAALTNNQTTYYDFVSHTPVAGSLPPTNPSDWQLTTVWPFYCAGQITSIVSTSEVNLNVTINGQQWLNTGYQEGSTWYLGAWTNTPGVTGLPAWPTCGTYAQGRVWFAGAVPNRFDASSSNAETDFSPVNVATGEVTDSSALAETFDSADANQIVWMMPDYQGIACGTQSGEWMITNGGSFNTPGPITATSIAVNRVSRYGCAAIQPLRTGISLLFVQRFQRRVEEFLADVFTGKYMATNLSEQVPGLMTNFIQEIWYQEEAAPVVWMRDGAGVLSGCTYRRTSTFLSEAPKFVAWHHHALGSTRTIASITTGPTANGTLDTLAMSTVDSSGVYHIEFLTPLFQEGYSVTQAWFLDDAIAPRCVEFYAVNNATGGLTLGGLGHLEGQHVTAWIGGLDCGDYLVQNDQITVPFGSDPDQLFSYQYLVDVAASNPSVGLSGVTEQSTGLQISAVVGFTFVSQGQILRRLVPQETGAANGMALGKTRRIHMCAFLLADTQGLWCGTTFDGLDPVNLGEPNLTPYPKNTLASGVYQSTISDNPSFDGMICWSVPRPYPATVCAVEGFVETQDR